MSKSVESEKKVSKTEEVDPENVLHREREKEKLNDKNWTSAILRDVRLYKKYAFRKAKNHSSRDKYYSVETYSSSDNPKEVLENIKDEGSEMFVKDEWKDSQPFRPNGEFKYKGQKYEYRERRIPVALVSRSPDTGYEKRIKLSKISQRPIDLYESLKHKVGHRVLVGRTFTGDTYLNTKMNEMENKRVTPTKRSKIIAGGMISMPGLLALLFILFSPTNGLLAMGAISLALAVLSGYIIYHGYKKTEHLYSGDDSKWIYNIPDDAAIRGVSNEGGIYEDFTVKKADIHSYDDGSIVIEHEGTKWSFESRTDGTPNRHAVRLIDDVSGRGNKKEFAIASKDEVIRTGDISYYESDDGNKILTSKSEYRDVAP